MDISFIFSYRLYIFLFHIDYMIPYQGSVASANKAGGDSAGCQGELDEGHNKNAVMLFKK